MQDLLDHEAGLPKTLWRSLAEEPWPSVQKPFRLFDDDGNMVPNATEVMAAWEAKCAKDLERANASYEAAQRNFLGNTEALCAIPSRMDQLRSHALGSSAMPLTSHLSSLSTAEARHSSAKTVEETLAEAESIIEFSKKQNAASNTLLEDLMKPEQRGPYR